MRYTSETALPDPEFYPDFYRDIPSKRLIAWAIDTVIILATTVLIVPFTFFTALFYLPFLFLAVGFVYRFVALARWSATPGMRIIACGFRDASAQPLSVAYALLHTTGYTLSTAFVLPQVVSIILMLVTPRRQGLSDVILGTAALNQAAAS